MAENADERMHSRPHRSNASKAAKLARIVVKVIVFNRGLTTAIACDRSFIISEELLKRGENSAVFLARWENLLKLIRYSAFCNLVKENENLLKID